jgi:hypothetical protein
MESASDHCHWHAAAIVANPRPTLGSTNTSISAQLVSLQNFKHPDIQYETNDAGTICLDSCNILPDRTASNS